jgi:hypothetical protein
MSCKPIERRLFCAKTIRPVSDRPSQEYGAAAGDGSVGTTTIALTIASLPLFPVKVRFSYPSVIFMSNDFATAV